MISFVNFVTLALALTSSAVAFPAYGSLAGLSREELDAVVPTLNHVVAPPPPPQMAFNGTKLVYDAEHPWHAPGPNDLRGPCPGMNTLANHGYIPRNGIMTPAQMITGVQEGFNMAYQEALAVVYPAHLLDGNLVTNLISIGGKSPKTGPDPPPPAMVSGLSTHNTFEGDSSISRTDAYFGNPALFNETIFDEFVKLSNMYGAGKYNYTVAGKLRYQRVQDSIATNPEFSYLPLRYRTSFAESAFPVNFFIDGRQSGGQLDLDAARTFFQINRMPEGFYRAPKPMGKDGVDIILAALDQPLIPGQNTNGVNTYITQPDEPNFSNDPTGCAFYQSFVNQTIVGLYPNPTGVLKEALNKNLDYLYQSTGGACVQVFPYGQDN